jgi:hypothetical protein
MSRSPALDRALARAIGGTGGVVLLVDEPEIPHKTSGRRPVFPC